MKKYNSIIVRKGAGGFGGPLIITPTEERNKLVYIVGGGNKPDVVDKIVELTGLEAINGFQTTIPDDEIAVVVIDCGGNLRCGIYPQKGILTINVVATGKAGPLAQHITEDVYVSAVTPKEIAPYTGDIGAGHTGVIASSKASAPIQRPGTSENKKAAKSNMLSRIGLSVGKVIGMFNQAARGAVQTMITTVIPFMAFVSLIVGIIKGTGVGDVIAHALVPFAGSIWGLVIIGFICSLPFLSPLLGPGAVIASVIGTLIGVEIGRGNIPPHFALPALFAINNQCGCDFIPVGLGLMEAEEETVEIGVPAILYSRVLTGIPRVLVAWLASVGMYNI